MTCIEDAWKAFPAGSYAISGLMRLLEIRESREIPTAAIVGAENPVLLLNPDFIARYANTPERQAALILHELLHLLLGHQQTPSTPLENFVFDAIINSMVCYMTRHPAYWSLFTTFYSSRRFPECLLRPAIGFRTGPWVSVPIPRVLRGAKMRLARQAYASLYSTTGTTYDEMRWVLQSQFQEFPDSICGLRLEDAEKDIKKESLKEWRDSQGIPWAHEDEAAEFEEPQTLPQEAAALDQIVLIGSHPVQPHGDVDSGLLEASSAVIESLAERLPSRSLQSVRREMRLELPPDVRSRNTAALTRLIEQVAFHGDVAADQHYEHPLRLLNAVPAIDRRSNVLRFLGLQPLLFGYEMLERRRHSITPVHVYLDVSGSATPYIDSLYRAVLTCKHLVAPRVHLFSTKVEDITMQKLARGQVPSWGGTDIHCVLEHMAKHGISRAVILTDGYVGWPKRPWRAFLRECHIGVALTPVGSLTSLREFVRHWVWLVKG